MSYHQLGSLRGRWYLERGTKCTALENRSTIVSTVCQSYPQILKSSNQSKAVVSLCEALGHWERTKQASQRGCRVYCYGSPVRVKFNLVKKKICSRDGESLVFLHFECKQGSCDWSKPQMDAHPLKPVSPLLQRQLNCQELSVQIIFLFSQGEAAGEEGGFKDGCDQMQS